MNRYQSWGKYPKAENQKAKKLFWQTDRPKISTATRLPFGQGRSYGDLCLNSNGTLLDTANLNRLLNFDRTNGILECEAGLTLNEILQIILPSGWFLPVTPGTGYISVGGAIANDVHGKNHHIFGTFGQSVINLTLLRSNGEVITCSPATNIDLFNATIAGLGLTGLILKATFKLKKVSNQFIESETVKFSNIDEFFKISEESGGKFEYTVSWVDCLAKGKALGRGLFMRGNHANPDYEKALPGETKLSVPIDAPNFLINKYSISIFNFLYYNKQQTKIKKEVVHYRPFFYPLDAVGNWNRLYGKRGFLQYQFVVPYSEKHDVIKSIMETIVLSRMGSCLAVLKTFGDIASPGMLSFPRKGVTLALDFAYQGKSTQDLLNRLDLIVMKSGGAIYPAKDARMMPELFKQAYPRLDEFKKHMDPAYSSDFWRRVIE